MLSRFARFSLAISEIDRCWHKLASDEMAKYDLNSPHAIYLTALYEHPGGITAAALADFCRKNKGDVSRMVAIMAKRGLVRKESIGGKFYRAKLVLTEKGKQAAQQVQQRVALAVDLASSGLTDAERETFNRCLQQITANLQILSKEGLPG